MGWFYVLIAGMLEITWASGLKLALNKPHWLTWTWTIAAMILSLVILQQAMRTLPLGTAYVVWTGIGAVGAATVGIVFFGESRDLLRLLCVGLIIAGIIGLKTLSPDAP